ncbi:hypothetical protein IEO21_07616 [Rhodonia placenta]|uniref:Uncharacterized protein n=1 Tax=Rhodonia placenta TaxID=104341 RepID=A0A8H7U005_9APHY|nr:hypothetical protein IEO21_07616 [Postia placenta]
MKAASSEQGRGNSLPKCDQDLQPPICVDDDDPVGWEEWYFQYAKHPLFSEREAYSLCAPLQGTGVPRWLGSGRSSLMDHGPRAITPRAFFLEGRERIRDVENRPSGNILSSFATRPTRAVIVDHGSCGVRDDKSDEERTEIVECWRNVKWVKRLLRRALGANDLDTYLATKLQV